MKIIKIVICYSMIFGFIIISGCASYISRSEIYNGYDGKSFLVVKHGEEADTLLRLDKNMRKVWETITDVNDPYYIVKYLEAEGGKFIGFGTKRSVGGVYVYFNPLIVNFDENGKELKTVVLENKGEFANAIRLQNGDYIAVGSERLAQGENAIIARFDRLGEVKWFKVLRDSGWINQILLTSSDKLLVVGSSYSNVLENKKLYVSKHALNGGQIWKSIFDIADGAEIIERYGNLIETKDGSYVIGGSVLSGKDDDSMFFVGLNSNGQLKWKSVVKSTVSGTFSMPPIIYDMKELGSKYFLAVGSLASNTNDGFISKISTTDGKEIWKIDTTNEGKKSVLKHIFKNSNSGYTLYGFSGSNRFNEELWVLKLNRDGEISSK